LNESFIVLLRMIFVDELGMVSCLKIMLSMRHTKTSKSLCFLFLYLPRFWFPRPLWFGD